MIVDYIAQRFDVHYNPSSVGALVHRLGFSYKTPRPRHRKAASREEQEAFKKKARVTVIENFRSDAAVQRSVGIRPDRARLETLWYGLRHFIALFRGGNYF